MQFIREILPEDIVRQHCDCSIESIPWMFFNEIIKKYYSDRGIFLFSKSSKVIIGLSKREMEKREAKGDYFAP